MKLKAQIELDDDVIAADWRECAEEGNTTMTLEEWRADIVKGTHADLAKALDYGPVLKSFWLVPSQEEVTA